jgi:hypothetical protein
VGLDGVDHLDAALGHPPVQLVDVEHARSEVVDVGAPDTADVGGDGGDPLQPLVPGPVHRLRGELERAHSELEEPLSVGLGQLPVALGAVGQPQQLRAEQLPSGEERLELSAQVAVEESRVRGREHRGEHPEGVAREFVGVDRPECRRDDRH